MRQHVSFACVPLFVACLLFITGCPGGGGSDLSGLDSIDDVVIDTAVGDNGHSCTDECPEEGAKECSSGAPRTCSDLDDDGCVEWSMPVACGQGLVCQGGECVSGCIDPECTAIGAKSCGTDDTVLECGDFASDGCLKWGNSTSCGDGLVCSRGFCSSECLSECTTIGAKKCIANAVVTCGDYNTDGCLEWGDANDCGNGFCSSGACADECIDECTSLNSRQCETGGYVICNEYDGDGCMEWGTVLFCGKDQVCSGGFCSSECTSDCTVKGARKCQSNSVASCDDYNDDGCLEWGSPTPCDDGLVCAGGNCATQCSNDCTVVLARDCDEGGSVVVCNDYNEDSCLEWGSPTPCDDGLVCSNGNCAISCANECEIKNERKCVAGTTTKYAVCDDYNDDSCLEWGTAQDCDDGLVCSLGNCAQSCSSECVILDEKKCVVGNGWSQCRDYNDDGCLEWGTPSYCESWEECDGGVCGQIAPPAAILIDEIMIDTTSSPDTDSFVELWGPAATDLTGWRLVGVNGSSNADYQVIDLVGAIGADGRFVVAHPSSQASIHDQGDQFTADVDYQNGPDNIQLRYGNTVVDAIGYGTFAVGDFFAGETASVPKPAANHSLARDLAHTDTGDNSKDFVELATPTPGAANQDVNEPPVAAIQCPSAGSLGEPLSFDGSGSDDPDGSLVTFAFDFGDDSTPVSGLQSVVQHTFTAADTFTVTLTVTDDRGASDSASCQIVVGDDNAPTVTFIKPANDTQVTQGSVVNVIVSPEAVPGRTIARVDLIADGVATGMTDDTAPYEFTYTVPTDQPNNTSLPLQAKAVDSLGSVGFGTVRLLVRNDVPVPGFTVVVSGEKQITLDAASSRDTETAAADLEVRWDFENDGTWDTAWSTEKVLNHVYAADGQYTIRMEVRDAIGQTASVTNDITLSSIQYVGGTVNTTTWTGTIVITGDVNVPSGQTLTVAPGTSVQFAYIDQDANHVGDYDITIAGTLIVDGTESKPVLFTVYGTDHRQPRAWNRIIINGIGSQVRNGIFEYADIAFEAKKDLMIEDTVIRSCREGLESTASAANVTMNRVEIRQNNGDGVVVSSGTVAADESLVTQNGGRGFFATGGTTNVSDSEVSVNGASGIEFLRAGGGLITRNLLTGNAFEGIRVWTDGTSDPTPVVNYNNIQGNATQSALVATAVNVSVSTDSSWTGNKASTAWTNPAGTPVLRVYAAYSEYDYDYYNYVTGSVNKDSVSGASMVSTGTPSTRWYDTSSAAATKFVSVVSDGSGSYYGTMAVTKVAYMDPAAIREASFITHSGTIDARHNYFGVFPNVLDAVTIGSPTAANVQGFVGVAFDSSWSKGIYFGGETITAATNWLGTIYITGDLTFSGTTLTVQAGTEVRFASVDQDGNGVGDYDLNLWASTFTVGGTSGSPVLFGSVGDVSNGFQEVKVYGAGTSDIQHAVFEHSNAGLHLETGTHAVTECTFQDNFYQGLWLKSNSGTNSVTITGGTSRRNLFGVNVEYFRNLSISRTLVEENTGDGIFITGSTAGLSMASATVRNNGGDGVRLVASVFGIDHCNIQYNDMAGVRYQGTSSGTMSNSNVRYNDLEGVLLVSSGGNPAPIINTSNIYGNSLVSGVAIAAPAQVASTDSSYTGNKWSAGWSTPAAEKIAWIRASYSEYDYDYYNYVTGSVRVGSTGGTEVFSASTNAAAVFVDVEDKGASSIYAGVADGSGSYYGTTTVDVAMYRSSNVPTIQNRTELAAATDAGKVDCKGNYWGTFPDIQPRFSLGRADAIDFQNFVGSEISGAGPLP